MSKKVSLTAWREKINLHLNAILFLTLNKLRRKKKVNVRLHFLFSELFFSVLKIIEAISTQIKKKEERDVFFV